MTAGQSADEAAGSSGGGTDQVLRPSISCLEPTPAAAVSVPGGRSASSSGAGCIWGSQEYVRVWRALLMTLLEVAGALRYLHSLGLVHRSV